MDTRRPQHGPNMTPKRRAPLGLVPEPKGARRSWPNMGSTWPSTWPQTTQHALPLGGVNDAAWADFNWCHGTNMCNNACSLSVWSLASKSEPDRKVVRLQARDVKEVQTVHNPGLGPDPRPLLAPPNVAKLNAWNARVQPMLKDLVPVADRIELRTEFSGAGTAEEAVAATVAMYNMCSTTGHRIEVDVQSIADWAPSAQQMAAMNHPSSCRFRDIMNLAPKDLRTKLQSEVEEKAPPHHPVVFVHHSFTFV